MKTDLTGSTPTPPPPRPIEIVRVVERVLQDAKGIIRLDARELEALVAFVFIIEGEDLDRPSGPLPRPAPVFIATSSVGGAGTRRRYVAIDSGPAGFPHGVDLEYVVGLHLTALSRRLAGSVYISVRGFEHDARGVSSLPEALELIDCGQLRERARRAAARAEAGADRLAAGLAQLGLHDGASAGDEWRRELRLLAAAAGREIPIDEQAAAVLGAMRETPNSTHRSGKGRPIMARRHGGAQYVAVGARLLGSADWGTFHDFLFDHIKVVLTPDWGAGEQRKPLEERHVIMQWNAALGAFMRANAGPGPFNEAEPDGPSLAFLLLSRDLYLAAHHGVLNPDLVNRLRHPDQFQGARYELAVASTLIRGGFDLAFEDERDRTTKHHEFIATHRESGERFAVEAKSRHRTGILGHRGVPQDEARTRRALARLLRAAGRKPTDLPKLVFLEVNARSMTDANEGNAALTDLQRILEQVDAASDPCPWNLAVITNTPHHYGAAGEAYPREQALTHIPVRPRATLRSTLPLTDLMDAVRNTGHVPREFPRDIFDT